MSSSANITGLLAQLINGTTESPTPSTSVRNLNPVSFSTAYYHSKGREENNRTIPQANATKKAIVLKHVEDTPLTNSPAGSGTNWFSTMSDLLPRYGLSESTTGAISRSGITNYPQYRIWILPDNLNSDSVIPTMTRAGEITNLNRFPLCSVKDVSMTGELLEGALIRIDFENRLLRSDAYVANIMNNSEEFGRAIFVELQGITSSEGSFGPCSEQGVAVSHPTGDVIASGEETLSSGGQQPNAEMSPPPSLVTCADVSQAGDTGPTAGGAASVNIDDEVYSSRQELFRRGDSLGYATEFVNINGKMVIKEVAGYVQAMISAASADGTTIQVTSGFRTMADQQRLYDKYLAGTGNLAAQPGSSNHQNGIAIDFNVSSQNGGVFEWLTKNAWKYGFIRTVSRERWHWEYWGDWSGVEKPSWANGWHSPKTMFSHVRRVHACGEQGGGRSPMRQSNWWTAKGADSSHTDSQVAGKTNSWIGFGDEHLPDKFDREDPGWDRA